MSEISIYDIVPTPKLADKLIGTSVGGVIEDVTYNFTLQELLQLFIPNIPANTLQGVLDYGNTATQNINLTGTISTTNLTVLATANILNSNLSGNTRVMAGLFDRTNASGTAGQFLRSTGTQVEWYTVPTVIPTLQQVLQSGNTSNISIILTANITAVTATADTVVSNTSLNVNGVLRDGVSAVGASNQILSSTGSGVRWVDMPVYNVISPLLYDTPTKTFSIQVASSSQSGYLSSADWINFDGKQDAIILTTSGTSGASTFVGNTLNIPVYSPDLSGYVPTSRTLTINGTTYDLSANRSWTIPAGVAEVTATSPLFSSGGAYPDITIQKADSALNGYLSNTDWITFNSKQAFLGGTGLVKSVAGTISYITDNSANWNTAYNDSIISAAVTGTSTKTLTLNQQDGGTVTASWSDADTGLTSVGVSMPSAFSVANSPLTSNGTIAITGSGTTLQYIDGTGALQTFPGLTGFVPYSGATTNVNLGIYNLTAASLIKSGGTSSQFLKADGSVDSSVYIVLSSLSASSPLSYNNTTGDFSISQSGAAANGYLSSTDWNTFNNKQVAGNYITSLTGEATGTGPGATAVTLNNASVTAKILTGVNITGGTVLATDTMLTAFGKLQNQINGLIGSTIYQGVWNANTNTPTLTSSVGTNGFYYIVNVAGATNLNGITDWKIGDWAIFNGGVWQKVDNTESVTSVNGFTGAVSLTTDNVAQGTTNLYFANSLARTAVSLTTTGSSGDATYNNTTGVFNIPNYGTALANYLPLTGGTLTGGLVINPANSAVIGLDAASDTFRLRSDSTQPFARQLTTTMGSGTTVKIQAAGYAGTYVTDIGLYTSSNSAVNSTPNIYLTGGDNRVGINNVTPAYTLDVTGTAGVSGVLTLGSTISNGTYSYTLPSATGTLALTSQIPSVTGFVPYTGATTDVVLGTNNLKSKSVYVEGDGAFTSGALFLKQYASGATNVTGYNIITTQTSGFLFSASVAASFKNFILDASSLTDVTQRTYTLPDASGIIALTSNLGSYVPYTGATGAVNLGAFDLTVNSIRVGKGAGAVATNTALGNGALNSNTTGGNNTAIGYLSLISNTTGVNNTSVGKESLYTNTTGGNNVANGYQALNKNTTGGDNTAIGNFALSNNTTASSNIAVGGYALFNNTTGTYNTSLGFQVNINNTTGSNITAIGFQANTSNTTGNDNTAIGYQSLVGNTTGSYNTAIGKFAGQYITTGSNNTLIGGYAGTSAMANNIVLSDGAGNIKYQWNGTTNTLFGTTTLTGALSGTSATFTGLTLTTGASTAATINSTGTNVYSSVSFNNTTTGYGYDIGFGGSASIAPNSFYVYGGSSASVKFSIASSGAATFSSSVTASKDGAGNANTNTTGSQLILTRTAGGGEILGIRNTGASNGIYGTGYTAQIISDGNNAIEMFTTGAQPLILGTNASPKLTILSGGNVGIGTTTPRTAASGTNRTLDIKGGIYFGDTGSESTCINNNDSFICNFDANNDGGTSNFFSIAKGRTGESGGSEYFRVTGVGNVGIGTASPTSFGSPNTTLTVNNINGGSGGGVFETMSTGTSALRMACSSTDSAIWEPRNVPILFATNNTPAMRITSGGNLLVGTTDSHPAGNNTAGVAIQLGGLLSISRDGNPSAFFNRQSSDGELIRMYRGGTQVGNISVTTVLTTYNTTSDYRLKEDLKPINGLEIVNKIKVYDYKWKSTNERMDGVMAHELAEILPYAVQGIKDGKQMQSVDYSKIVPVMVQAIKDLKQELDLLKNK
jgi:hypothetical protein